MIKGKKGINIAWESLVVILVLLFLAGTILYIIPGPFRALSGQVDTKLIKARSRDCATGDMFDQFLGSEEIYDRDITGGDGMPDNCDICLGGGTIDTDRDGNPDACDEKLKDPAKRKCKEGIRRKDREEKFYCCVEEKAYTISISEGTPEKVTCEKHRFG